MSFLTIFAYIQGSFTDRYFPVDYIVVGDLQRSRSRFVGAIHGIHSLPGAKVLRRFLGHRSRGAFFVLVYCKVPCFFFGGGVQ